MWKLKVTRKVNQSSSCSFHWQYLHNNFPRETCTDTQAKKLISWGIKNYHCLFLSVEAGKTKESAEADSFGAVFAEAISKDSTKTKILYSKYFVTQQQCGCPPELVQEHKTQARQRCWRMQWLSGTLWAHGDNCSLYLCQHSSSTSHVKAIWLSDIPFSFAMY